MSPLDKLHALHDDLVRRDMYATARDVNKIIDEMRPYFEPFGDDPAAPSAPRSSSHFRAWRAVVETLDAVHPHWHGSHKLTPRDAAVAAIRSMAAQCSAQPAPGYARPMGVPAIRREQIDALVFANGFMYAKGHEPIADQLAALVGWLRTNAPQE